MEMLLKLVVQWRVAQQKKNHLSLVVQHRYSRNHNRHSVEACPVLEKQGRAHRINQYNSNSSSKITLTCSSQLSTGEIKILKKVQHSHHQQKLLVIRIRKFKEAIDPLANQVSSQHLEIQVPDLQVQTNNHLSAEQDLQFKTRHLVVPQLQSSLQVELFQPLIQHKCLPQEYRRLLMTKNQSSVSLHKLLSYNQNQVSMNQTRHLAKNGLMPKTKTRDTDHKWKTVSNLTTWLTSIYSTLHCWQTGWRF